MKGRFFLLAGLSALLLLGACAAQKTKQSDAMYLASDIVVVPVEKLKQYWVWSSETIHFKSHYHETKSMCASVQVIIDSNGHLFNPKLIEEKGSRHAYADAVNAMAHTHYVPAKTNPDHIPVQTILPWDFEVKKKGAKPEKISCGPDKI